jgi:methylated-DNA-[protein]-cysteine S-methyltransferase
VSKIFLAKGESPYGDFVLTAGEKGVISLEFENSSIDDAVEGLIRRSEQEPDGINFPFPEALDWLKDYFLDITRPFPAPLDLTSGTPFQRRVWDEVFKIPHGKISTYSRLAVKVGSPSPRAVGTANGRNPLSIIVPCHRVVGKDGNLTGYYYGIKMKATLLKMEGVPVHLWGRKHVASLDALAG